MSTRDRVEIPIRCVNCEAAFERPSHVGVGSELECPICDAAIVLGGRARKRRRDPRTLVEADAPQQRRRTMGKNVLRLGVYGAALAAAVFVVVAYGTEISDWVGNRIVELKVEYEATKTK